MNQVKPDGNNKFLIHLSEYSLFGILIYINLNFWTNFSCWLLLQNINEAKQIVCTCKCYNLFSLALNTSVQILPIPAHRKYVQAINKKLFQMSRKLIQLSKIIS